MAEDQDIKDLRKAIGRSLSSRLGVEREMPERLAELLHQLKLAEDRMGKGPRWHSTTPRAAAWRRPVTSIKG